MSSNGAGTTIILSVPVSQSQRVKAVETSWDDIHSEHDPSTWGKEL